MSMPTLKPCIDCGAPWLVASVDPEHTPDCPSSTDVWPVRGEEVVCLDCDQPIDDFYTHIRRDGCSEIVCLGCAALSLLA